MGESLPWLLDSVLSIGVILHGICNSKPEFNSFFLSNTWVPIRNVRLYFVYLIAGYWSYFSGLALAPYRAFYAMAAVGGISFALRLFHRRNLEKKEVTCGSRKHSHRHWKFQKPLFVESEGRIPEGEPWRNVNVAAFDGFEFGNSLSTCRGKAAYINPPQTPHGGNLVHWAAFF